MAKVVKARFPGTSAHIPADPRDASPARLLDPQGFFTPEVHPGPAVRLHFAWEADGLAIRVGAPTSDEPPDGDPALVIPDDAFLNRAELPPAWVRAVPPTGLRAV